MVAKKIRRNDPCPCGSGKKYKKCCLGKAAESPEQAQSEFSEEEVLRELLANSLVFRNFYQNERPKIKGKIPWKSAYSLPDGVYAACRFRQMQDGQIFREIQLRHIPPTIPDAVAVAHEMVHLVLSEEGFRGTQPIHPHPEVIAVTLNNTVADPLVWQRLQAYGFDLSEPHNREVREKLKALGAFAQPLQQPTDNINRAFWVMEYAQHLLEWHDLYPEDDFKRWFDNVYPQIAAEGQSLATMIKGWKDKTPEGYHSLYKKIITGLRLDRYVVASPLHSKAQL